MLENRGLKVFTVASGKVTEGIVVEKLSLKNAGVDIPAIIIGEEGRGRERSVLPVQLTDSQYKEWQEKGQVTIFFAEIGKTKAEKPKLFAKYSANTDEKIVCVFRTKIGYRGGNSHTGDRIYNLPDERGDANPVFGPFPGEKLASGSIAQGSAGRMGSGEQLAAMMPKDTIFRTGYSGRLYGGPGAHYYKWDGQKLLSLTWDERVASDLF
ncbi:hypothetical protein KKB43_04690 [Patescibacteria group bacterium]|nr:hypothetical protein [Patescibacteria group bacterium]